MRPRFIVEVSCAEANVMDALREGTQSASNRVSGDFTTHHGVLTVPEEDRQFWSTQLGLTIKETTAEDGNVQTRVLGIFSPHPEVWTGFVFAVGTLIVIGFCGLLYSVVQLILGHPPWALAAPALATIIGGLVYTSTLVGQGLAAAEMYRLRVHLDGCLADAQRRARRVPKTAIDSARL
jgi:hypothetical protein